MEFSWVQIAPAVTIFFLGFPILLMSLLITNWWVCNSVPDLLIISILDIKLFLLSFVKLLSKYSLFFALSLWITKIRVPCPLTKIPPRPQTTDNATPALSSHGAALLITVWCRPQKRTRNNTVVHNWKALRLTEPMQTVFSAFAGWIAIATRAWEAFRVCISPKNWFAFDVFSWIIRCSFFGLLCVLRTVRKSLWCFQFLKMRPSKGVSFGLLILSVVLEVFGEEVSDLIRKCFFFCFITS